MSGHEPEGATEAAAPAPGHDPDGPAPAPPEIRRKLALALDVDDLIEGVRLAQALRPWFGVVKVGLELYSAAGPDAITTFADLGFDVFADLKLCDIPTTVNRAARVLGTLGASYLTAHAFGGGDMLRAGVEGFRDGASAVGLPAPSILAVTVLTSDGDAPPHILPKRVATAVEAGCGGIVCAGSDVREARQYGPRLTIVVPGTRPAGAEHHDQARVVTPSEALEAGADLLVVGRVVTRAADPAAAAASLVAALPG
jgi:orotidine-5'-phosphate decarboxylase